ncbi:Autophagy-related protein 9A, partial [Stegodyphus mimosarum]
MQKMIADIHYVPDHFKKLAHTSIVRDELSHLFQYKFTYLLEELFSPLITPYILIFHLRHRALDIVDFFRSFTVDVAGVGDVCSFSLMDVTKHGNHNWLSQGHTKADQYQQAEDGKTELSLIHFTLMNPHWKPPPSSNMFIQDFKEQVNVARE